MIYIECESRFEGKECYVITKKEFDKIIRKQNNVKTKLIEIFNFYNGNPQIYCDKMEEFLKGYSKIE